MLATPVAAQEARPSGIQRTSESAEVPRRRDSASPRLPARLSLGALGSVAGLFGGALLGGAVSPVEDCACDDPGLENILTGAVLGAAAGAAILAALPGGGGECGYRARLWRAMLGSALGTGLGLVPTGNAQVITVPLGASVGAALGGASCAWQRRA